MAEVVGALLQYDGRGVGADKMGQAKSYQGRCQ